MNGGPPTAYLGISGVLHPSESLYQLLSGRSAWADGHTKYEGVPYLEKALRDWPEVRITLTSTQPWAHGLAAVLERLGPTLAARVNGYTYEDLTSHAKRFVVGRSGSTRAVAYSDEDYWRMNKAQIVDAHVRWFRPHRWVAIDDEDILWTKYVRENQLVLTNGCVGLLNAEAQERLDWILHANFGP